MKFYVTFVVRDEWHVEVEASTPEEAQELADRIWEDEGSSGLDLLHSETTDRQVQKVEE